MQIFGSPFSGSLSLRTMIRAALLSFIFFLLFSLGDPCCRRRRRTPPRHGRWGSWFPTHRCCTGILIQNRRCDNPSPAHGGRACSGDKVRFVDCNECSCNNGGCQHICRNYRGGHSCSCKRGYLKDGNKCKRITCHTSHWPAPQNGRKTNCERGRTVNLGTVCHAQCHQDYRLIGHSSSTCGYSGNWIPATAPRCQVKTCNAIIPPKHGRVTPPQCNANTVRVGTTCYVTCEEGFLGFDMYGSREHKTTCTSAGSSTLWTKGNRIICKDVQRPVFTSCPTKEIVVYAEKMKTTATVSWKPIEAKDNDGKVPQMTVSPQIIRSSSTDYTFQEGRHFITYQARDLAGNTASCSFPVMVKVKRCSTIFPPLHGKTLGQGCSNLLGSKCIFECYEGYNITGSSERQCVEEEHIDTSSRTEDTAKIETEKDVHPKEVKQTRELGVNETTSVGVNETRSVGVNETRSVGVNATKSVGSNETISGKIKTTRLDPKLPKTMSLRWTGVETKCKEITCSSPPVPKHAEMLVGPGCFDKNPRYKTICSFECGPGYKAVSGSKTRMCKKDGFWSGEDLVCKIVRCHTLPKPSEGLSLSNKSFVTNESLYQDECHYKCSHGYLLSGPTSKKCSESGQWSPNGNPFCRDISTPSFGTTCPSDIQKNARRKKRSAKIEWECPIATDNSPEEPVVTHIGKNPGDEFNTGYHTVQYKATDKSGNFARCMFQVNVKLISCAQLLAPLRGSMECSNENIYGSECSFHCNTGYILRGSSQRTCEIKKDGQSGYWTGNHTYCEVITCPILEYPENGFKTGCLQHTFGEKCLFYCNMGFKVLSGSSSRTCRHNGTWSGTPLACKAITCPGLKSPLHGKIIPDECENSPGFRVTCQFLCDEGYRLAGNNIRTCLSKGQWNDNTSVTCKDVERPRFTQPCPYNIDVFAEMNQYSARVNVPSLDAKDNSGEVPTVRVHGAKKKYPAGRHRITITATDSSGNTAVCRFYVYVKILRCYPHPSNIFNGQALDQCNHTYGSTCRFKCNDGYNMTGSSKRTCQVKAGQIQGYWSGTMPYCKIKRCHPLKMLAKGYVYPPVCSASNGPVVQTTCKFGCYNGFARTSGITSITCGNNGRWDQDTSTIISCKDTTPPMFTKSCPADIRVVLGNDGTATATWIVPVAEDNTLVPPQMKVEPSNAIPPYTIKQSTVVTYSATDDAGNVGKCSFRIIVEDNQGPQVVYCPSDFTVLATQMKKEAIWKEPEFKDNSNDKITVSCNRQSGASFYWGEWNILCRAYDKNPNNKPGECSFKITVKPKPCPALKPPNNGAKACDIWMFGSFCAPMCNANYDFAQVLFHSMWVCGAKGTWFPSNRLPDCSKVYVPKSARKAGSLLYYFDGDCNNPSVQAQIKRQFIEILKNSVFKDVCIDKELKEKCNATNVAVECGLRTRRRRTAEDFLDLAFKRAPRSVDLNQVKVNFELSVNLASDDAVNKTKAEVISQTQNATNTVDEMVQQVQKSVDRMVIKIDDKVIKPLDDSVVFDETIKFECSYGQSFVNDKCVSCSMGTYLNKTTERCMECSKGWYQHLDGQESCIRCPDGMSTVEIRSKHKSDCKEYCKPGSYSPTGLESCSPCEKGSYQNKSGQVQCIPCSDGLTTQFPGTVYSSNCSAPCSPGTYSSTGLVPCMKCEKRSYQPNNQSKSCIPCDGTKITLSEGSQSYSDCVEINECDSSPCQHDSTCVDLIEDYSCICKPGYAGKQCHIDVDDCESFPCLNNGTCHDLVNNFTCSCTRDFKGDVCQTEIERCDAKPCKNGATCHDLIGGFKCYCQPGYNGETCDNEINECETKPCANGGICFDKVNSFKCLCKKGYSGPTCEEDIDECASNPCVNGAECKDLVDAYTCTCLPGYIGMNCDLEIDECKSNPCLNNGTCFNNPGGFSCACMPGYNGSVCEFEVDECLNKPCLNNGTCQNYPGSYLCTCPSGFQGDNCESDVDHCASQPCANNADCKNRNGTFECLCVPGFTGETCDIDINECKPNPCTNEGICFNEVNKFTCNCPDGYSGTRCQIDINECAENPCKHNGTCQDGVNSYTCTCSEGFTGVNCETDVDECSVNPCEYNGRCRDLVNDYTCECMAGYSGKNCSTDIDECVSDPCLNYGTCEDLVNGYRCSCQPGFTGKHCGQDIDDCKEHACLHNATCVDAINSYLCICPEGYKGEFCGAKIGPCDSFPCHNGGACSSTNKEYNCTCAVGFTGHDCEVNIDDCQPVNPCKNNGICTDLISNYTCTCPQGFYGPNCEYLIDHCLNSNCTSHGTCINSPLGFKCNCSEGYYGEYCGHQIQPCDSSPCLNGANCTDVDLDFNCTCRDGFTGKTCKIDIDECKENKCLNNGSCVDQVNGYYCVCWDGYNGTNCEHKMNSCENQPCLNNGTCTDVFGGYKCNCTERFDGQRCEHDKSPCSVNSCFNGGKCTEVNITTFNCTCSAGYTGPLCDVDIDECASSPCPLHSNCVNKVNNYSCICHKSHTGKDCEIEISDDFDVEFKEKSSSDFVEFREGQHRGVQDMDGLTIALWVKPDKRFKTGTIMTYRVPNNSSENIEISFAASLIRGVVRSDVIEGTANILDGKWHFIGITWSNDEGLLMMYVDGKPVSVLQRPGPPGHPLNGSGFFILGQKFSSNMNNFIKPDSFVGALHQVNVWREPANSEYMWNAAHKCHWPVGGNINSWVGFLPGVKGKTKKRFPTSCKVVEQCTTNCTHYQYCYKSGDEMACVCDRGYTGQFCDVNIDDCLSDPCVHGTCVDDVASYRCDCQTGYRGNRCEKVIQVNIKECPALRNLTNGQVHRVSFSGKKLAYLQCNEQFTLREGDVDNYECGPETGWKWNGFDNIKFPRCLSTTDPIIIRQSYTVVVPLDPSTCRTRQEYINIKSNFEQALLVVIQGVPQYKCFEKSLCKIEKIDMPNCRPREWFRPDSEMKVTFSLMFREWEDATVTEIAGAVHYQISYSIAMGNLVMLVHGKRVMAHKSSSKVTEVQVECMEGYITSHHKTLCVACPLGTHYNVYSKKCIPCSIGYYQDTEGSTECKKCRYGYSTKSEGAEDEKQCEKK